MKKHSFHVGVSGICRNAHGEVLLLLRDEKDEAFPGMWCTPGGGLEEHETFDNCLIREFKEETGLIVSTIDPWSFVTQRHNKTKARTTVLIFKPVTCYFPDTAKAADGHSDAQFFELGAIRELNRAGKITPMTYEAISYYFELKNRDR